LISSTTEQRILKVKGGRILISGENMATGEKKKKNQPPPHKNQKKNKTQAPWGRERGIARARSTDAEVT